MNTTLYYIHDPMCSWCWAYRPEWHALQRKLPDSVQLEYIAGGLAPDSTCPMPVAQQDMIKAHWLTIKQKLGTQFNFDFWTNNVARRSTYNACRAVISTDKQGFQEEMIEAIQRAYYLRALNPSDSDVLIDLASELSTQEVNLKENFELTRFIADFTSDEIQQTLVAQINLARELTNQGFPSLVLEHNGLRYQIKVNYKDHQKTLVDIKSILAE